MESITADYAAYFRFSQRPFSLTPDPRFYFRSRSHVRALESLSTAIARRDCLMLVLGDLGVGKTTLCRTLLDSQEHRSRAALVGNALLSPDDLLRLMLQDLGAISNDVAELGRLQSASHGELVDMFNLFLGALRASGEGAIMIVDEAHSLPTTTREQVVEIAGLESNKDRVVQFLFAAQPTAGGGAMFPSSGIDRLGVRARLLPLERDECEAYILHRLRVAGGNAVTFSHPAVDVIYTLSGGVPRLVNLLCERALQHTADGGSNVVEPQIVESVASALDLLRLRPKRFRWYGR
jgi:general secretion pathway protein A